MEKLLILSDIHGNVRRAAAVVAAHTDCTACHTEKYWSHRRVGQARGSMAALIELL